MDKRNLTACLLGSVLEWYDFVIYASLTPIIVKNFFPQHIDSLSAFILSFTIFAMGFLTRPLGGLCFGYLADKYGRKKAFISSIACMFISSVVIALLPNYNSIGIFAPVLLSLMRLLQGFSVGGEYPSLIIYLSESVPANRKGLISSLANVTTTLGVLLATLITTLIYHFIHEEALFAWGWRIPFLLSALFAIFSYYLRNFLKETAVFQFLKQQKLLSSNPVLLSLWQDKLAILKIVTIVMGAGVAYYSYNFFTATYFIDRIGFSHTQASHLSLIGNMLLILFIPLAGYISDKIGKEVTIIISTLSIAVLSIPIFILYNMYAMLPVLIGHLLFAVCLSFYLGALPAYITSQTNAVRGCTILGIAYNLSLSLFGGTAPMINLTLLKFFQNNMAPCGYLIITALISLIAVINNQENVSASIDIKQN